MSAKLKITLWITLMMLLVTALVLSFVFVVNANAITDDPAGQLVKVVQRNAASLEYDHGRIEWEDVDIFKRGVYSIFYDKDMHILNGALPQGFDTALPICENIVRTAEAAGHTYYVYDSRIDMQIAEIWIRGVISADDSSSLMHTLLVLALSILPALVIISLAGGWLIASNAFRPVERIISTANEISDTGDLSRRLGISRGARELQLLSGAFDRMFEKLEKAFLAEKQFSSDASHELRTPITVILAECDRARRKDRTQEDFLKSIAVIEEQSLHMSELVQSLLAITRMQHGTDRYPLRTGDLSEFTQICCEEFVPEDARGISLSLDIRPSVYAKFNPALMSRLIMNLLQNAYKYGRENGQIQVSLSEVGRHVQLSVTDDGIGIAPENLDKVWQRFWQAEPSRTQDGSSGLGLSMVREIAIFHGGEVSVKSRIGEGSSFTLTLRA